MEELLKTQCNSILPSKKKKLENVYNEHEFIPGKVSRLAGSLLYQNDYSITCLGFEAGTRLNTK